MKTTRLFERAMIVVALVALSGCDGDETSGNTGTSCGAFSACGGNVDGSWQIDDACVVGDLLGALNAGLASLPAACHTVFKSAELEVSGTVEYSANVETTNITLVGTYTAVYSKECLSAIAGEPATATQEVCAAAQASLEGSDGMMATCTVSNGGCSCSIEQQLSAGEETDSYTVQGNSLVYSESGNDNAFCIEGDTMQMRQSVRELGITIDLQLHRIE